MAAAATTNRVGITMTDEKIEPHSLEVYKDRVRQNRVCHPNIDLWTYFKPETLTYYPV